ncbi:hypothetical protein ACR6C2_18795 [Streptomyces sp. INA 01156]
MTRPTVGTPAADGTRRMPVQRGPEGMLRDPWQEDARRRPSCPRPLPRSRGTRRRRTGRRTRRHRG